MSARNDGPAVDMSAANDGRSVILSVVADVCRFSGNFCRSKGTVGGSEKTLKFAVKISF